MSSRVLALGFAAGFVATLIFHQGLWYVFNHLGVIPWSLPAWPMDPIPPLDVPSVFSKSFWGGLWGLALTPALSRLSGANYWIWWTVAGALLLTAFSFFVVWPLKGQPIPPLWPRFLVGMALNGAWGLGTALVLRLSGAARGR